jgi:hypothetical protein
LNYPAIAPVLNIQSNNNFSAVNVSAVGPLVTVTFEVGPLHTSTHFAKYILERGLFENANILTQTVCANADSDDKKKAVY